MKEYECVEVDHHRNIGKTIGEWQNKGWHLHTYACSQAGVAKVVNHYLLFERESDKKMPSSAKAAAAASAAAAAGA
nr:hypothetical protein [Candidatus Njordarchaeum guaymaensis]